MPITKLRPSFTFTEERLAQLRAVVPEAFADGRINREALLEALGEHLEEEGPDAEHFGLFWPGKREARRLAMQPSHRALVLAPGEGINEPETRNLFIEGENLQVLKLLLKAYAGQVKCICIDPLYNTGSDLIYLDDYGESESSFLLRTGQADQQGLLVTNTRADGRFHSNWLSMMYPRLQLARQLLREDGVIFTTIDDNEGQKLRLLMDEVFGEENFVASVIWQKMDSPSRNDPNRVITSYHDYILVYARNKSLADLVQKPKPEIVTKYPIQLPDGRLARRRQLRKNGKGARREDRPTMWYPLTAPDGSTVYPIAPAGWEGRWVLSKETWQDREKDGLTEWIKRDYGWVPYYIEIAPTDPNVPWPTLWTDVDQNRQAKAEFTALMGSDVNFDNPKPSSLIKRMLQMVRGRDYICLDFFGGSCTTAQAVLETNRADGGSRRFIMVQIAEPSGNTRLPTISEIGKERIRRVIKMLRDRTEGELDLQSREDLGFRAYCLDHSNFKAWRDYEGQSTAEVQSLFDRFETPLVDGWKPEALLIEIMLLEGFPLDSAVTPQTDFQHNQVQLAQSDFCAHRLFVCLDDELSEDTIRHLALNREDIFVCLDSALTDQDKMRLSDTCNLHVI